jgi:hypothetical protein
MLKVGTATLIFAVALSVAHAAGFTCKGKFKPSDCFCTETIGAKSTLGYNAAPDEQGVPVNITCVNHDTGEISYYTAEKQLSSEKGGLGATYKSGQTPNE